MTSADDHPGGNGEDSSSGDGAGPLSGISTGPLSGIRVLELGSYIAGPFACRLLGDFGADVIKVERPGSGDELRRWRLHPGDSDSMLWRVLGRNKRSVALDLGSDRGKELLLDLVEHCDVVVENFRPGTLERLGLGPDVLRARRDDLVLVRVSGFGQTGPLKDNAGFGGVAEAFGGLRNLTGYPDLPPTRVGIALGDSLAGMHAAFGAVMSLLAKERSAVRANPETVDVALYEAVFNLMESLVPDYDAHGVLPERNGSRVAGVAPSSSYPCSDGRWVVVGGNGDAIFGRLMSAIDRPDLADAPDLGDNAGRVARQDELDEAIGVWTAKSPADEVLATLDAHGVPAGLMYTAAEITADPHYEARGMIERHAVSVEDGTREVAFPGVVPRLDTRPGSTRWLGPSLGAHTTEVFREICGVSEAELDELRSRGVLR